MMAPSHYTRITLADRLGPTAEISRTTFKTEVHPFDLKAGDGQVLVQVLYISLDPVLRLFLGDTKNLWTSLNIGDTILSTDVGIVLDSGHGSKFSKGDIVRGLLGWTDFKVVDDKEVTKNEIPSNMEPLDLLGPLGDNGLTAYFGLLDVARIKAGETLVVTGAAGATGSHACQIGKTKGAKVFAVAGSAEKVEWLEKELGVDKAFNYKSATFHDEFEKSVGKFDVLFDNVGGDILDYMLTRLNVHARVAFCGAISQYNGQQQSGLKNYFNLIAQRAKFDGFSVLDYAEDYPGALKEIAQWVSDGRLKRQFHVIDGLENAPSSLNLLFTGGNIGKLVVKVADSPSRV